MLSRSALALLAGTFVFIVSPRQGWDLSASGTVIITPSKRMHQASLLVVQAPSLGSTSGVTYGGKQFDNNTGLMGTPQTQTISPDAAGSYSLELANASAVTVTINP